MEKEKAKVQKKCPSCKKNLATKPHTCPIRTELYNDSKMKCRCCHTCKMKCAFEV